MKVTEHIPDIRAARWADSVAAWGLVPTMGYLHAGHLSLVERARAENDRVAVSIFVNPTQFNNPADLATYPRNLAQDLALLAQARSGSGARYVNREADLEWRTKGREGTMFRLSDHSVLLANCREG